MAIACNSRVTDVLTPVMTRTPPITIVVAVYRDIRVVDVGRVVHIDVRTPVPPAVPVGIAVVGMAMIAMVVNVQAVGQPPDRKCRRYSKYPRSKSYAVEYG
jgi:hypothetical protein